MELSINFWYLFFVFIAIAIAVDLGVFHRRDRAMTFKESAFMTGVWILLASLFCSFLYYQLGSKQALEFMTGYIIELSLSMDNIFIFALIFAYFKVPLQYQYRLLFWGVIGAIFLRFAMIAAGIMLVDSFKAVFFIFGALLIYSGIKIVLAKQGDDEVKDNKIIALATKFLPISTGDHGNKFFVKINGAFFVTRLFVVLLVVEETDLIFALDSIPAILAITQDPFIVFSSNIFAILGLRSLYFMLARLLDKFAYLKYGLCGILVFIGFKMMLLPIGIKIPTHISLAVVLCFLIASLSYSFYYTKKSTQP